MKRITTLIFLILFFAVVVLQDKVIAQTTTLTPTSQVTTTLTPTTVASTTATMTATPTKVTALPQTGIIQYSILFFVVSVGVILFALVF